MVDQLVRSASCPVRGQARRRLVLDWQSCLRGMAEPSVDNRRRMSLGCWALTRAELGRMGSFNEDTLGHTRRMMRPVEILVRSILPMHKNLQSEFSAVQVRYALFIDMPTFGRSFLCFQLEICTSGEQGVWLVGPRPAQARCLLRRSWALGKRRGGRRSGIGEALASGWLAEIGPDPVNCEAQGLWYRYTASSNGPARAAWLSGPWRVCVTVCRASPRGTWLWCTLLYYT